MSRDTRRKPTTSNGPVSNGVGGGRTDSAKPSDLSQSSSNKGSYEVEACNGHAGTFNTTSKLTQRVGRSKELAAKSNWRPSSVDRSGQDPDQEPSLNGGAGHESGHREPGAAGLSGELGNLALLVLLYMLQGIPMGLTMGAMPFMLQSRLSYAQLGTFSLAAYPYSLKLLWSPVVDSLYLSRMGRRKTWIVPIQFCTAFLLLACSNWISELYEAADVNTLTVIFFIIVLLAATQDIAVDGWALTLLPPEHVTWAATCQTVGTSTGFFTSFTVFLALQDATFCNKYVRPLSFLQRLGMEPSSELALVTLPGYLRFWGAFFVIVTAFIWLFKPEDREPEQEEPLVQQGQPPNGEGSSAPVGAMASLQHAYGSLWGVIKLRAVWGLVALLLTYRLGVLTVESVAGLKLIEKGVPKELLAVLVLVQFPIELVSALVAGRWAASASPSAPFLTAYWLRLIANTATIALVAAFPTGHTSLALTSPLFLLMAAISLFNSAVNSLAFTALGSLFNSISDPEMGGAYLTLLNTIANMGVILPRAPAFYLIDALTKVACLPSEPSADSHENLEAIKLAPLECPVHPADLLGPSACADAGGVCSVVRDGFYSVCWTSLAIGAVFGVVYVRYLPALLKLPLSAWRANVQLTARRPTQASNAARPPPKARSD